MLLFGVMMQSAEVVSSISSTVFSGNIFKSVPTKYDLLSAFPSAFTFEKVTYKNQMASSHSDIDKSVG